MTARDMRVLSDARMILHRLRFDDANPCDDRLDEALYRAGAGLMVAIERLQLRRSLADWNGCTAAERIVIRDMT